jgi:16S rRNA (cytosine1407-C5)-methyltransferase
MSKFPDRFVERIQDILPKKEWDDFFLMATEPLSKSIRIASKSGLEKVSCKQSPDLNRKWKLTPTSIPEAFFIQRENQSELPLGKTLEHFSGGIYIASLSSLLSVHVLDPKPEEKILDVAAAPGSKSTFIADRMKNTGVLVVNEPSSSRSMKLASNLDRMGVENEVLLQSDGTYLNTFFVQEFDRILLDAPCSSEGFGRKDSTFFEKMWSEKKIFEAAKLQKKLIKASFEMLASGGTMIYSTCTSAPEENEAVVQYLINTFGKHVEILPIDLGTIPHHAGIEKFGTDTFDPAITKNVRRIFPHLRSASWNSEIFFIAKIKKTSLLSLAGKKSAPLKSSTQILGRNQSATVIAKLCKTFGFKRTIFEKKVILERNDTLFITTKAAAQFATHHSYRRAGLPMIDKHGNIMSPFAIHYGPHATENILKLTTEEKERWLEGFDLSLFKPLERPDGTEIFVQYEGFCLGHGKVLNKGKKLKNKLDRSLVF